MAGEPRRVAFFTLGGVSSGEDNQGLAEAYCGLLERIPQDPGKLASPAMFEAKAFPTLIEAIDFLQGSGTMVFMSISLESNAKQYAKDHPQIHVVLLTGKANPKGEVLVVPKEMVNEENLQHLVQRY